MIRELLKMGDPRLLRVAKPIADIRDPSLAATIADLGQVSLGPSRSPGTMPTRRHRPGRRLHRIQPITLVATISLRPTTNTLLAVLWSMRLLPKSAHATRRLGPNAFDRFRPDWTAPFAALTRNSLSIS